MKIKALVLSLSLIATPALGDDYCLGEWSEDAETYCNSLMRYVQTIVIDRSVGRPKQEVLNEIVEAAHTYNMPVNLAHNYVQFIYAHNPPLDKDIAQNILIGGCIDNWEKLQELAREELTP